jgi:hypothetical protein
VSRKPARASRKPLVLVFGESPNDRRAVKLLVEGLRPDLAGLVEERREPLVLIRKTLPKKAQSNAEKIAGIARTEARTRRLIAVLAHEDCDALEPEHVQVADKLERELSDAGCPNPVAVAPAWEIEAWWLVFPEAVGKVVHGWRDPDDWLGKHVGLVKNAKEELRRVVRPRARHKSAPRAYQERDSIAIAQNVVADGLLPSFDGVHRGTPHPSGSTRRTRSESFGQFRLKVLAISTVEDVEA